MLGLGNLFRRNALEKAWAATQVDANQPDTVILTDWAPEDQVETRPFIVLPDERPRGN